MTMSAAMEGPDPERFTKLAAHGFNVIPLERRGKKPVQPWMAYQQTRASATEVLQWQKDYRDLNVGIVCGPTSDNRVALDLDNEHARGEVERQYGPLPITPTVRTARGQHLYLIDRSERLRNFVGKIEGVDLRGMGGYCVGPGSIHPSGAVYRWERGLSPDEVPFADVPPWLYELAEFREPERRSELEPVRSLLPRALAHWVHPRVARYALKALENAIFEVEYAPKGRRNIQLNTAAFSMGQLVAVDVLDRGQVEQELFLACERNGLLLDDGERSVCDTIRSGITSGLKCPRDLGRLVDPWGRPAR